LLLAIVRDYLGHMPGRVVRRLFWSTPGPMSPESGELWCNRSTSTTT